MELRVYRKRINQDGNWVVSHRPLLICPVSFDTHGFSCEALPFKTLSVRAIAENIAEISFLRDGQSETFTLKSKEKKDVTFKEEQFVFSLKEKALLTREEILMFLQNESLEGYQIALIYGYLLKVIEDGGVERDDIDLAEKFYSLCFRSQKFSRNDSLSLNIMMTSLYVKSEVYWRGRKYANDARDYLLGIKAEEQDEKEKKFLVVALDELSDFYHSVSDYASVLKLMEKREELIAPYDFESYYQQLIAHHKLHDGYQCPLTEDEIKKRFKKDAEYILKASKGTGFLQNDPIENTKEFQDCFDEVHEEVLKRLEEEGNLHFCLQTWSFLASAYLERGIIWKSPQRMNPKVKFD